MTDKKYKKQVISQVLMSEGRIPPQATDLEDAVLGAIMIETHAIDEVIEFLKPDMFYREPNRLIYQAAIYLKAKHEPIDLKTISYKLRESGELDLVGGPYHLTTLTSNIVSSANIVFHARIIYEKWVGRELIRIANETAAKAYDDTTDIFDLVGEAQGLIKSVSDGSVDNTKDISELARNEAELVSEAIKRRERNEFIGIPSGLVDLDKITGGWQKAELIILGARPAMGKSRLSLTKFVKFPAKRGIPVAFYSLEMSEEQVIRILACSECDIDPDNLKKGIITTEEYERYVTALSTVAALPIFIRATGKLTINGLEASAKRLQRDEGIELIVIDYLQKISASGCAKGSSRTNEVDFIAANLKTIANELKIPVIAIASMSRAVEQRGGAKRPQLSDLRESGNIESDADIVMFLYRPSYYGVNESESGQDITDHVEVIFEKNRNGKLSTEIIKKNQYFTNFYDMNPEGRDIPPNKHFDEPF